MSCLLYLSPRIIRVRDGYSSGATIPHNGLLAGCTEAENMARAYLYDLLEHVHLRYQGRMMREFVDDLM
eukprot:7163774-Pyramimonas_sp.AAC.1